MSLSNKQPTDRPTMTYIETSGLHIDLHSRRLTLKNPSGKLLLTGDIGKFLDQDAAFKCSEGSGLICAKWDNTATLKVLTRELQDGIICYDIQWDALNPKVVPVDSVNIGSGHWYGGPELYEQHWPINEQKVLMQPYVTNDYLQATTSPYYGSVLERYWLNSAGVGATVALDVPLHMSANAQNDGKFTFKSEYSLPYENLSSRLPHLHYTLCVGHDMKSVHQYMQKTYLGWPMDTPDIRMLKSPVWSTWARYKMHVNQEKVLQYAQEIMDHGFPNSQLEIDDMYTTKYGEFDFDTTKFPDAKTMVKTLHRNEFRVTAWIVPFANTDTNAFNEGMSRGFWVKDKRGRVPALTKWWQGVGGLIDVTNPDAVNWFVSRLKKFQKTYNLDSFKFDAGESFYVPHCITTHSQMANPSEYTTKYAALVVQFGANVELRAAYQSQKYPIFVRMFDKDSYWGYNNGLKTLIPTVFQFGILGYPYILPDMIGGNAYGWTTDSTGSVDPQSFASGDPVLPDRELYIRWMQLTTYLPSMQFSLAPWQYDEEVVEIARRMMKIHEEVVTPIILEAAKQTKEDGSPIIRPLWWLDTQDDNCLNNDSEFLVGDEILVAPVLDEGAKSRDIYIPRGIWLDEQTRETLHGPTWLRKYPAPLTTVPTFRAVRN
ncbi:myogenesis-regulating glycosidase-like isoform X2 [Lineus longissimus]|uniref:myogenesis-regulating glycosidase-like isoform X2 n=1 Tax=Lineus longissimus TaxID=88925 RepID=UPI002B4CD38A